MNLKQIFYDWDGANLDIFSAINSLNGTVYDQLMLFGTALVDKHRFPLYLALLCIVAAYSVRQKSVGSDERKRCYSLWKNVILVFILAFGVDAVFLEVMKHYFHYPRPFVALPAGTFRIIGEKLPEADYYKSFPSGHASFAVLIAASLWPVLPRLGKFVACVLVVWGCWSRIALGAHYPADVLTGAVSSLIIVLLVAFVLNKWQNRRTS